MTTKDTTTPRGKKTSQRGLKASRHSLQLLSAVSLIIIGSALLIAGFCVPPAGEIHPSILVAFGEVLTFSGAVFGIRYHYKYGKA